MLHDLPRQYREDPWVMVLALAICGVLDDQDARAVSMAEQLSLDKLTWDLETEERLAGIVPAAGASLEDRRSAVKSKWRSGGKVTIQQLQAVADAWHNGEVAISFPDGRIRVQFVGSFGVPTDMDGLKRAIAMVVPAHLPVDYVLRYLLIRDVHEQMTLAELAKTPLDHFAGRST